MVTYYASFLSINTSVARDCIKCSCVHVRNDHFVRRNEGERSEERGGRGEEGEGRGERQTDECEGDRANTHNKFA